MYSGTRSLKLNLGIAQVTPAVGLILALAGVGTLVFFAGQQAVRLANRDIAPGMSGRVAREMRDSESDGAQQPLIPLRGAATIAGTNGSRTAAGYAPPPVVQPPAATASAFAPFPDTADQRMAKESLEPVKQLLATVRKQDSELFASSTNLTATAVAARGGDSKPGRTPFGRSERVQLIAAALGSETALALHPDRFPEPLRDGAGEISREIRAYLANAELSAGQTSEGRASLQASGSARLARAEKILAGLEAIAAGGADDGSGGIPSD